MTQQEKKKAFTWLYAKLNTLSSAIESTFKVLKENENSSYGRQMAALVCVNSAIKYAELSMQEIENTIKSLSATEMTAEEKELFKSISNLKDSISSTIEHFNELDLKI